MQNDGPANSFVNYTYEWVKKANRGGLFVIPDEACRFFLSLELATSRLPGHLIVWATSTLSDLPAEEEGASTLEKSICEDDDALFYWTFVGIEVEDEEENIQKLLIYKITLQ